ncbi:hypothetical protein ACWCPF_21095 [Streptomyces sp. NPDC001858]
MDTPDRAATEAVADQPGHCESDGTESSAVHLTHAIEPAHDPFGPSPAVLGHASRAAVAAYEVSRRAAPEPQRTGQGATDRQDAR